MNQEGEILILCKREDRGVVDPNIVRVLENNDQRRCLAKGRDFHLVSQQIFARCDIVILVVTQRSQLSTWIEYDDLHALQEAQKIRAISLVVATIDCKLDGDGSELFGFLQKASIVNVSTSEYCNRQICRAIQESQCCEPDLPVCNLAVGLAWSHFTGFSRIVLPALTSVIQQSKWYRKDPDSFLPWLFELYPTSGRTDLKLTSRNSGIRREGSVEIRGDRGMNRNRPYTLPVYSITINRKKWYFIALIPNSLGLLYKISVEPEKYFRRDRNGHVHPLLTKGELCRQREKLFYLMNRLINHPSNPDCKGLVRQIVFNDAKESIDDVMTSALYRELGCRPAKKVKFDTKKSLSPHVNGCRQVSVYVAGGRSQDEQRQKAEQAAVLMSHGYEVLQFPAAPLKVSLKNALHDDVSWIVVLVIPDFLKSTDFPTVDWECRKLLHQKIEEGMCKVIALLHGVQEADLPNELGWVTTISTNDPYCFNNVAEVIDGVSLSIAEPLGTADAVQGLGWGNVVNYLSNEAQDKVEILKQFAAENRRGASVMEKLIIAVPSSCIVDPSLTGERTDGRFRLIEQIEYKKDQAPDQSREYQVCIFSLQVASKEYLLTVDFANPLLCLQEMSTMPEMADLRPDRLQEEAQAFWRCSEKILRRSLVSDYVKLLHYDTARYPHLEDALIAAFQHPSSEMGMF